MSDWLLLSLHDISLFNLGLLVVVLTLLIATVNLKKQNLMLNHDLNRLRHEVRAMNSGQLGMGRTISKVVEEIAHVEQCQAEVVTASASEKTYQQAGLLLSRGASIEEVVQSCDIAPAEAELLAIVRNSAPSHRSQTAA